MGNSQRVKYRDRIANRIAKVNAAGDLDTTFNPQTGNNGFNNVLSSTGVKKDAAGNPDIINLSPQNFDLKSVSNHLSLNVGILF